MSDETNENPNFPSSDTPRYENEVPFEVPEGWVWTTLGELCSFLSRGKSPKYSEERKYPVFAQKCNLYDGDISLEKARFLDPETISKWSDDYKLIDGDILVNSTGTGTVGRTRLFHSDVLGDYPFVVPDSHVSVIRSFEEIESKFVLAFLSSDYGQTYIEDNLAGSTNQKELYIGVLDNMQFPLPPHEEQFRIVTTVDKWFTLIDTLESAKEDLQTSIAQAKSRILDLAIHGKLVPQDPNDEPAIELLKRINPSFVPCDNAHYENIPDSWCIIPLGNICGLNEGKPISDKEYPYIDVKGLRTGNYVSKQSGKYVPADTTLIIVDGENSGEVFHTPVEGYQGSTMKVLDINSEMNALYVLYFVKLYQKILRENKVGSAIPHLNKKMFRELVISVPPLEEQERIIRAIQQYYCILDNISANL